MMRNTYPDLKIWLFTLEKVEKERRKKPMIPEPPKFYSRANWWGLSRLEKQIRWKEIMFWANENSLNHLMPKEKKYGDKSRQYIYFKPQLNGHKILYKTHKYCIFEVNDQHPFEGYEKKYQYLLFDGSLGFIVGCIKLMHFKASGDWFCPYIEIDDEIYQFVLDTPKEVVTYYKRLIKSFKDDNLRSSETSSRIN